MILTFCEVTSLLHLTALPSKVPSLSCGKALSEFVSTHTHSSLTGALKIPASHKKNCSQQRMQECAAAIAEATTVLTCWLRANRVQRVATTTSGFMANVLPGPRWVRLRQRLLTRDARVNELHTRGRDVHVDIFFW